MPSFMMRFFRFLPRRWWSPKAWRVWASYVHWRLETYGVFYPEGKTNWGAFWSLLRQMPAYRHWLAEMDAVRKKPLTLH
jgi:hypothetical protein